MSALAPQGIARLRVGFAGTPEFAAAALQAQIAAAVTPASRLPGGAPPCASAGSVVRLPKAWSGVAPVADTVTGSW